MKKIISCISVLLVSIFVAKAQNADPLININMNPPIVQLGSNASLEVQLGNFAFDPICDNSLIVTITVGANAEIMGIAPSGAFGPTDARWTQVGALVPGPGNSIQLSNTGGGFGILDLGYVYLTVKGVVLGGPLNVGGNIAYIIANNPCAGGAPNSSQGNALGANDNSTTSLVVTVVTPLHFTGFNTKDKGCSASISWTTADEQNVSSFEVQQSFDGINYSAVKTVASQGAGNHNYEVTVSQPSKRMYYRVLAIDVDNRKAYGPVLMLQLANCTKAAIVQVFPIPAFRDQKVTLRANVSDKVSYRVIDAAGKTVQTGMFVRNTQIGLLNSGTYIIEMTGESFKETQTIVIQ